MKAVSKASLFYCTIEHCALECHLILCKKCICNSFYNNVISLDAFNLLANSDLLVYQTQ